MINFLETYQSEIIMITALLGPIVWSSIKKVISDKRLMTSFEDLRSSARLSVKNQAVFGVQFDDLKAVITELKTLKEEERPMKNLVVMLYDESIQTKELIKLLSTKLNEKDEIIKWLSTELKEIKIALAVKK